MTILLRNALCTLAVVLAISALSPEPSALAQTAPSVLPSGGGKALLDTSDTVILLLDHQTGLFQTVKDICVMFPALDAKAAGFKVYAVIDASGDPSEMASRVSVARFAQAGVIPTSTNAVLSETHRTWNRPEAAELAKLYGIVAPNYAAVMESYGKAQEAAKQKK